MRAETHVSMVRAEIGRASLSRHDAVKLEQGRIHLVATALGPPRLWTYGLRAAIEGFTQGLATSTDLGADERVGVAIEASRRRLADRCDELIERMLPDVALVVVVLDGTHLHVHATGTGRVYLHRGGTPQRLTSRDERRDGILHAAPTRCTVDLEPEDVVLAGSDSAFSVRAVGRLAAVLEADRRAPPAVLASLLTEPAGDAGVGAIALAMRMR